MRYRNQRTDHPFSPRVGERGVMNRKILSLVLVFGLVGSFLAACSNEGGGAGGSSSSPSSDASPSGSSMSPSASPSSSP